MSDTIGKEMRGRNARHSYSLELVYNHKDQQKELAELEIELKCNPKDADVLHRLGVIYNNLGRCKEADRAFRQAGKLKPARKHPSSTTADWKKAKNFCDYAFSAMARGENENTVKLFNLSLKAFPGFKMAQDGLRAVQEKMNIIQATKAVSEKNEEYYCKRGMEYYNEHQHLSAITHFKKALEFDPESLVALNGLLKTYTKLMHTENISQTLKAISATLNKQTSGNNPHSGSVESVSSSGMELTPDEKGPVEHEVVVSVTTTPAVPEKQKAGFRLKLSDAFKVIRFGMQPSKKQEKKNIAKTTQSVEDTSSPLVCSDSEKTRQGGSLTGRAFWEDKATPEAMAITDKLLKIINTFAPGCTLNFDNKEKIGLMEKGSKNSFVFFEPKKQMKFVRVLIKQSERTGFESRLEDEGIEVLGYNPIGQRKIRLFKKDVSNNLELIHTMLKEAYKWNKQK